MPLILNVYTYYSVLTLIRRTLKNVTIFFIVSLFLNEVNKWNHCEVLHFFFYTNAHPICVYSCPDDHFHDIDRIRSFSLQCSGHADQVRWLQSANEAYCLPVHDPLARVRDRYTDHHLGALQHNTHVLGDPGGPDQPVHLLLPAMGWVLGQEDITAWEHREELQ